MSDSNNTKEPTTNERIESLEFEVKILRNVVEVLTKSICSCSKSLLWMGGHSARCPVKEITDLLETKRVD